MWANSSATRLAPPTSAPSQRGSSTYCCTFLELTLPRSEEHTSELQSPQNIVCRLLLEKKESWQTERHDRQVEWNAPTISKRKNRRARCSPGARGSRSHQPYPAFFFKYSATPGNYRLSPHRRLPV